MKWLLELIQNFFKRGTSIYIEAELPTGYTNPKAQQTAQPKPKPVTYTPQSFLDAIHAPALVIEGETGIPWMFAATQAAHESRYGNSKLSIDANNLFGITGDSWVSEGKQVYWIETQEYNDKKEPYMTRRPFRKYADWAESLRDWASLIKRRYPEALAAAKEGDFADFANKLQKGGYATDPTYAVKLAALHRNISLLA